MEWFLEVVKCLETKLKNINFWKILKISDLSNKIKTVTLMKHSARRMLRAVLNKSWNQHSKKL